MSLRPRYSLLTLLILTALVAGGVKLWYGPHHVNLSDPASRAYREFVQVRPLIQEQFDNPQLTIRYSYTNAWNANPILRFQIEHRDRAEPWLKAYKYKRMQEYWLITLPGTQFFFTSPEEQTRIVAWFWRDHSDMLYCISQDRHLFFLSGTEETRILVDVELEQIEDRGVQQAISAELSTLSISQ